jgi:hypothetical protein
MENALAWGFREAGTERLLNVESIGNGVSLAVRDAR